jgi:TolA-binding protein
LKSPFARSVLYLSGHLAMLIIVLTAANLLAGEIEELNFAKKLMRDGMYVAAAEEFLRFAGRYPDSPARAEAVLAAGESFMKAGKATEALRAFDEYLGSYPSGSDACKAGFYKGRILKALERYNEAAGEFLSVAENHIECTLVDQALLEAGNCLLSAGDVVEATSVLRRLVYGRNISDVTPRGMLSLALALERAGRDIEGEKILGEIVDKHPESPVAALALLGLAEKAAGREDFDEAIRCLQKVEKGFEEEALRERASLLALDIHKGRGDDRLLLGQSIGFLERHHASERRAGIYAEAIRAASRLGDYERALKLIDSFSAEEIFEDPSGEIQLIRARALSERGKRREAVAELENFRYDHARSPLLKEAYKLEADLRLGMEDAGYARRLYGLLLLEPLEKSERVSVLERMADLSASRLADTTSAIRYWRMLVEEEPEREAAVRALFELGSLLERIGDGAGAAAAYRRLVSRFPESPIAIEAEKSRKRIELRPNWGAPQAEKLAQIAASEEDAAHRSMRVGICALDGAGDARMAKARLDQALKIGLPDSVRGMAKYKLAVARHRASEALEASGKNGGDERKKALSLWLETAREFVGTYWGGMAHRRYLEEHFADWTDEEGLVRIGEYLSYYGEGEQRWWALGRKVDILYRIAQKGDSAAASEALAIGDDILRGGAPSEVKGGAAVRRGYLFRILGGLGEAAEAFKAFVSGYGDDARCAPVLYDLGEVYLEQKKYEEAVGAYEACLKRNPPLSLAEKCLLRKGDSYYYMRLFEQAAAAYNEYAERYPSGDLAGEASFREALALEKLGNEGGADSILDLLVAREDLAPRLRTRVLRKLGERRLAEGRSSEARRFLDELVKSERSHENLLLLARCRHESGDYKGAVETYTGLLRFEEADSCMVISGRARANLGRNEFERADRDLEILQRRCAGYAGIAAVLLEKGIAETKEGHCDAADSTFGRVRSRYSETGEAADALYYLALCDMKRGGYEIAAGKLEMFLRTAPQSPLAPEAYFKLASSHFALGNLNLASRNYALAAEAFTDPDREYTARWNLGSVYQELEDWGKAAETWKLVSERYPGHENAVEVLFNLGFCYNQTGQYGPAYEVYRRIPDIAVTEEQRGRSHYWAGVTLKNLGRYTEAVREFLRVPYLRTGGMWGVTSKLEAAACLERMGETEEALKIYRDVIKAHGGQSDWGRVASQAVERITGSSRKGEGSSEGGENRRDES